VTSELIDLQLELNVNQEKQNELLAFTSKLTEKNTSLQSENATINERLQQVQAELERATSSLNQSNDHVKSQVIQNVSQVCETMLNMMIILDLFNKKKRSTHSELN
jgi:predicted nuclease with TOPRIM domain